MREYGVTTRELAMIQPTYSVYSFPGSFYANGGVHVSGYKDPSLGIGVGFNRNTQYSEKNWLTHNIASIDYGLNFQQWSSNVMALSIRISTGRKLFRKSAINLGLGYEYWQNGNNDGTAILPSIRLMQHFFNINKISFAFVGEYAYHSLLSRPEWYPTNRIDVSALLRMSYSLTRISYYQKQG
jgi:hypothetical protein